MLTVSVGTFLPEWTLDSVSPDKMKVLTAITRDSNPLHYDPDAADAIGLGRRTVNQGGTNLAYVLNMLSGWLRSQGTITEIDVQYMGNVFSGDAVVAGGRVETAREDAKGSFVELSVWLDVVGGERVISGSARACLASELGSPVPSTVRHEVSGEQTTPTQTPRPEASAK